MLLMGGGQFTFTGLPVHLSKERWGSVLSYQKGGSLFFQSTTPGEVTLSFYDLSGLLLHEVSFPQVAPGFYRFSPGAYLSRTSSSMHILKLTTPDLERSFKTYFHTAAKGIRGLQYADNGSFSLAKTSAAIDTLKVTCDGFIAKEVVVHEYNSRLDTITVRPPNFVLVFLDDAGYGDFGKFGAKGFETPHLDKMADEGVMFTNFYVPQAVCGASRAALLTGTLSNRINMTGAPGPGSKVGIHKDEMLISELVKQKGYATAMFGKWHLGDAPKFLPIHHGFDEYIGLPYSNDMWPYHPTNPSRYPPLPLIDGDFILDEEVDSADQTQLTTLYTEWAVDFIQRQKNHPFFLYVAHSQPHVPLFVSEKFEGKSELGPYGDVMMEIDWSMGEILKTLKETGLDSNTFVIITSDNGPWTLYGNHSGSTGILEWSRAKQTMFEGGARVPCIMRWPGHIPAGTVVNTPAMTIDIFPTYAHLMNGALPNHLIDGKNIWPLISSQTVVSPHEAYIFYYSHELNAVRQGKWKLHFPHQYVEVVKKGADGKPGSRKERNIDFTLFDLETDIQEQHDVSSSHPDIVDSLTRLGNAFNKELQANKRPRGEL